MKNQSTLLTVVSWVCRIIAALVLVQTLFFKFTGAEESVYIFTQLGAEPWGRWASGTAELIVAVLLVVPRTAWLGAILGLGIMFGAILSHLTKLGIVVVDDGGFLFGLALVVTICCAATLFIHRRDLPVLGSRF
jgi:uncharacterized membrane protein YphA (DoxX/SURF4 family)